MIDSHAHLDFPQFDRDRPQVMERAWRAGLEAVVNPGADLASSRRACDLAGREERMRRAIPLGRLGKPEDIAPFITFLATPEASYATGATFVIDGGLSVA